MDLEMDVGQLEKAVATSPILVNPKREFATTRVVPRHYSTIHNSLFTMSEQSIKSLFASAESKRRDIETSFDSNSETFRENLAAAIATYEECRKLADRLSLFSPNESLEDITSGDLQ